MSSFPVWNSRGLIFGPEETEESFYKRCQTASSFSQITVSPKLKKLFDINPDWVEVTYSKKGLHFWEGGCTWIEENRVTLQLTKALEKRKSYLGIYSKEELLAHEMVHVVRQAFEEPIFEEILAYKTSTSKFRRYFGPLFRTSRETKGVIFLFLAFLAAAIVTPFYKIAAFSLFALFAGGLMRLFRTHQIFSRANRKLAKLTNEDKALFIMMRLKDREIIRFSKMREEEIRAYIEKMQKIDMRWQQIYTSYFEQQPIEK